MTARRSWIAVVLALLLAGCGSSSGGTPTSVGDAEPSAVGSTAATPTTSRTPIDITDIGQLRTAFNQHAGQPRLIVLMSPT